MATKMASMFLAMFMMMSLSEWRGGLCAAMIEL